MKSFVSFAPSFEELLAKIIARDELHAQWLNTLSYLENCGARKIAACEHPTLVKEEMLKHAAEEFRHAHYLKRQISKLTSVKLDTYDTILGKHASRRYLDHLNLRTIRFLKEKGLSPHEIRETAYLLVTYAIELRASELYPIYDALLRKMDSRIAVKSILLEEKEHLNEMEEGIALLPHGWTYADQICHIEGILCQRWVQALKD